jgi:dTDP-glucose 4,6-dehydratase/UDP-glucuronate decarboxylase
MTQPSRWPGFLSDEDLRESWDGVNPAGLEGKTVLVTGASGCIGGGIAESLCWMAQNGVSMKVVVASRNLDRLDRRFGPLGATVVQADLSKPLPDRFPGFDWAVHAASVASPRHYLAAPIGTLLTNALGLESLAQQMGAGQRLLYISSGEIYGSPGTDAVPTPETYLAPLDQTLERACYTEGKRFAEALAMAHHRERGLHAVISRPIHVYGPGLLPDDGRVICDFASRAARGEAIRLLSDGKPSRAFCYLSDANRLHLHLLLRGAAGLVCNVGRQAPEISVRELAQAVSHAIREVPVEFGHADHTKGSPMRSCPDMSRAANLFGYRPRVELEEGLTRLVDHWRKESMLGRQK